MSSAADQQTITTVSSATSELVVSLDTLMPSALPRQCAAAVFCIGSCFHRREAIKGLEIMVDGIRHRVAAFAMPRPDVLASLQREQAADIRCFTPTEGTAAPGTETGRGSIPPDLELRGYRSGFWATIPMPGHDGTDAIALRLAVRLASDVELVADLGLIEIAETDSSLGLPAGVGGSGDELIAVCMATFEPDMRLFRTQIDSLRAQSDRDWICLISDDCSSPERFAQIKRVVEEDPRFLVSRSGERLGFYRNFERALRMIPAEAKLVALCDQDDRWLPDKLQVLRGALGTAQLIYSDQRLVDAEGRVLRDTLWEGRRNNYDNLASELVANTIAGAAMLLRRELLELALPFPDAPGVLFHDHWIGMAAMASGEVAFVARPLYDYVQHSRAVFGNVTHGSDGGASHPHGRPRTRTKWWKGRLDQWRAAYFYGYLPREVMAQTLLIRGGSTITREKRRILQRFIASASSPGAFAWLAVRALRAAVGLNETLGSEVDLVRGIAWRWLTSARARRARTPHRVGYDARPPDPASFEQRRLRRWRADV